MVGEHADSRLVGEHAVVRVAVPAAVPAAVLATVLAAERAALKAAVLAVALPMAASHAHLLHGETTGSPGAPT